MTRVTFDEGNVETDGLFPRVGGSPDAIINGPEPCDLEYDGDIEIDFEEFIAKELAR